VEERGKDISELTTPIKSSVNKPLPLVAKFVGNKLEIQSDSLIREIKIFDINNREVLRLRGNGKNLLLDVSSLKAGVYVVHVMGTSKHFTKIIPKY
jgi:hypothetical protein